MTDIAERLQRNCHFDDCQEGAKEIWRLRERIAVAMIDDCQQKERIEELELFLQELLQWCDAYPEELFTPLKGDPFKKTEDYDTSEKRNLITRASAQMGRHILTRWREKIEGVLGE